MAPTCLLVVANLCMNYKRTTPAQRRKKSNNCNDEKSKKLCEVAATAAMVKSQT